MGAVLLIHGAQGKIFTYAISSEATSVISREEVAKGKLLYTN